MNPGHWPSPSISIARTGIALLRTRAETIWKSKGATRKYRDCTSWVTKEPWWAVGGRSPDGGIRTVLPWPSCLKTLLETTTMYLCSPSTMGHQRRGTLRTALRASMTSSAVSVRSITNVVLSTNGTISNRVVFSMTVGAEKLDRSRPSRCKHGMYMSQNVTTFRQCHQGAFQAPVKGSTSSVEHFENCRCEHANHDLFACSAKLTPQNSARWTTKMCEHFRILPIQVLSMARPTRVPEGPSRSVNESTRTSYITRCQSIRRFLKISRISSSQRQAAGSRTQGQGGVRSATVANHVKEGSEATMTSLQSPGSQTEDCREDAPSKKGHSLKNDPPPWRAPQNAIPLRSSLLLTKWLWSAFSLSRKWPPRSRSLTDKWLGLIWITTKDNFCCEEGEGRTSREPHPRQKERCPRLSLKHRFNLHNLHDSGEYTWKDGDGQASRTYSKDRVVMCWDVCSHIQYLIIDVHFAWVLLLLHCRSVSTLWDDYMIFIVCLISRIELKIDF